MKQYSIFMDKILKEDDETFSSRFGPVDTQTMYAVGISNSCPQSPTFPISKTIKTEKIDFVNESFDSTLKRDEDSSYYSTYEKDLVTADNCAKFPPGKNFPCPYKSCKKVYTSSYGLKYHMDHGHTAEKTNERRPYMCTIENCGKTYKNNNGLKYHIQHAHKDHPFADSQYFM